MPTFAYTAVDSSGKSIKGKITANNELDLEERLNELGLTLVEQRVAKQKAGGFFNAVTDKDLIMFCVHIEQLDKAGVPLLESVADMRDSADSPALKGVLTDLYENVKAGDPFSVALQKRKDVFDEIFVGLVAAGEKTGNIGQAFHHLSHHLKWNSEFKRSMKKAIRYPIALLIVMSIVITLMMLLVVPQLVSFMQAQGFELPIHTRALIATSNAFKNYWYLIFGTPIVAIISIIMLYKHSMGARYTIDALLLKMPALGPVILKINLARFSHFFAITFNSGIGVLECLDTGQKVVTNLVIKESISFIKQNVSEGNRIYQAISATQRFPNLVIRMFKVGEDSGNMEDALHNINFFYDREVEDSVNIMIGLIQPTLTLLMGVLMFWIIAAVFGPLYSSFSKIKF